MTKALVTDNLRSIAGVRMGRIAAGLIALAAVAGTIAYACADGGYETSWDAKQSSAILSPANDTRTNLFLLLADRQGSPTADPATMAKGIVPIDFPWRVMQARLSPPPANDEERWSIYYPSEGDGSRCHSNATGAAAFVEAVKADRTVPEIEKAVLVQARQTLGGQCAEAARTDLEIDAVRSASGQAFATYLVGAQQFYVGDFPSALNAFRTAASASQPWLRETANYMIARTVLNQAQQASFDEYGSLADPEKRDIGAIDEAGRAFADYLKAYPQGRYAGSARGLLRRVAWLKDDRSALGAAYSGLLNQAAARGSTGPNTRLIEEIDLRLLPPADSAGVTDPLLRAVVHLMRLRPEENGRDTYYHGKKLDRAELEREQSYFKSEPQLFGYLLAAEAFYGRKQPKEVLALIPDAAQQKNFTSLQFSRQRLRGFALEAVKDRNARGFWLSLLPGAVRPYQREAVELALADHDGTAGQPERLFVVNSPIRHPLIRQHMLEDSAGAALLRQQAKSGISQQEREVSLYLLLAGEIHHGLYVDFLKDVGMVNVPAKPGEGEYHWGWSVGNFDPFDGAGPTRPPLYVFAAGGSSDLAPCPEIRATAASLAANPAAVRPRLCLAEFIRRKGFDGWGEEYDGEKMAVRARNGFPGQPLIRIDIYRSVIASSTASADDKAFALNRAIRCFAPSGYSSCGGNEIAVEQRKAWFERLKRDYPQSVWARDLKYYW